MVRQERIGLHMATRWAASRGDRVGVFAMQQGPGTENAFGGVAQAYGESVPVVVMPAGYPRASIRREAEFHGAVNFRHVTKSVEQVTVPPTVPRGDAPRLHPGSRTAGPARCWSSSRPISARGDPRSARLPEDAAPRAAPTRRSVAKSPRRWSRPSGRSSSPARASITPRPGRSCRRSPSCSKRRS